MLTLKLQAMDYKLTLLSHKSKSDPFPKQRQDQSPFQAEHFRPKSCYIILIMNPIFSDFVFLVDRQNLIGPFRNIGGSYQAYCNLELS